MQSDIPQLARERQDAGSAEQSQSQWYFPPSKLTTTPIFDWNASISALTDTVSPQWPSQSLPEIPSQESTSAAAPEKEKRVPRPPNAWILYRSDCIQKLRAMLAEGAPRPTQADMSKQFGEKWRNEDPEVKARYERLATIARDEHAVKYPDWKFSRKVPKGVESASSSRQGSQPPAKRSRTRTREDSSTTPTDESRKSNYTLSPSHTNVAIPNFSSGSSSRAHASPEMPAVGPMPSPAVRALHHPYEVPYVFPQVPRYAQAIRKPSIRPDLYASHSYPSGLHNTLARRSSSAVELFNVYESGSTLPAALNASCLPEHVNTLSSATSMPQSSAAPTPVIGQGFESNQEFPSFYSTSKVLSFTETSQALPAFLPFGMSASAPSTSFGQPAGTMDGKAEDQMPQVLDPKQLTWLTTETPQSIKAGSSTHQQQGQPQQRRNASPAIMPEWLALYRGIRVRQDDVTGVPLSDFLSELSSKTNLQASGAYAPVPLLITPPEETVAQHDGLEYAFPGSL